MRCDGSPGDGLGRRPRISKPRMFGDGLQTARLHHQGTTVVGLDRSGKRRAVGRGSRGSPQGRGRLRGGIGERISVIVLVQHRRDQGPTRGEVRSGINTLEERLVVDAGVATLLVEFLPVRRVIVVINRTLVNVVVTLEHIVVKG